MSRSTGQGILKDMSPGFIRVCALASISSFTYGYDRESSSRVRSRVSKPAETHDFCSQLVGCYHRAELVQRLLRRSSDGQRRGDLPRAVQHPAKRR